MKNTYSIAERNRIVEEHLHCIDTVIRQNRPLIRAAASSAAPLSPLPRSSANSTAPRLLLSPQNLSVLRGPCLDRDDVYQDLAIRLIKAVESFDPEKGTLEQHIYAQLQYELLSCKSARRRYGLSHAPHDLRGAVVSLDACPDELPAAA